MALKFIILLLVALLALLAYFTYQANQETHRDQLLMQLDKTLKSPDKEKQAITKELNPLLQEFILKIVVRGLPSLKKAHQLCQERIEDEFIERGIDISSIDLDNERAINDIKLILKKHLVFFEMSDLSHKIDSLKYFFPQFEKGKSKLNPYYAVVPKKVFFQTLETYMLYQSCLPDKITLLMERLTQRKKNHNYSFIFGTATLGAPLSPTQYYDLYLSQRINSSMKKGTDQIEIEKEAIEVHDLLNRTLDQESYERINQIIHNRNVALSELEQSKKKISNNSKESSKKGFFSELRSMDKEKRKKFLEGIKHFNKYIKLNEDEILDSSYNLETSSVEHDVVILTSVLKKFSHFLDDSLFNALEFHREAKDEEIAAKTLTVLGNFEQYINKGKIKELNSKKQKQLTKREMNQVQQILQSLESQ
jgi:hypothetical protein